MRPATRLLAAQLAELPGCTAGCAASHGAAAAAEAAAAAAEAASPPQRCSWALPARKRGPRPA